ncbi:hypothetical protein [Ectopseudomonas hydrolytica]|uniref:hypothetical protein n=1 Tax=Ectopseudomonas hydrolytica TaxID=2493633 RepID=UPI0020B7B6C5|nr:hypothetical protein [Pseudomonas hydrolytica]UTH34293.1 hypothetical protein NLY38_25850 [Pseudomonas hydrolytica]UZZ13614.1 hypothetical protein NDO41_27075 [Pseudomonas mendocina]
MNMHKLKTWLAVALIAAPGIAAAQDETGPEALAAFFMAQMYEVEAAEVEVTPISKEARAAVMQARAPGGHACRFEMAPAPASYEGKSRWLVGGLSCDQRI